MIAASAVLVVIAFVTLIIGIFQTGLGLIWVSIASSVLAAIFLLLGVVKGRPPRVAPAGATTYPEGAWGDAPAPAYTETAPVQTEMPPAIVLDEIEEEEEAPIEEVLPPRRTAAPTRASASRPAAKTPAKTAAKSRASASKTAKTPAAQMQVVVIPDRDKFHKTTCRYAKGPGTMKLTKSEARREGYKACGVCKP